MANEDIEIISFGNFFRTHFLKTTGNLNFSKIGFYQFKRPIYLLMGPLN